MPVNLIRKQSGYIELASGCMYFRLDYRTADYFHLLHHSIDSNHLCQKVPICKARWETCLLSINALCRQLFSPVIRKPLSRIRYGQSPRSWEIDVASLRKQFYQKLTAHIFLFLVKLAQENSYHYIRIINLFGEIKISKK